MTKFNLKKIRLSVVVPFTTWALMMVACGNDKSGDPVFTIVEQGEDTVAEAVPSTETNEEVLTRITVDGKVDCSLYAGLAAGSPKEIWDYRLGPSAAYFHDGDIALKHVETGPQNGEYCHMNCRGDAVDWAGKGGQTLYLTDGKPGMDRTRFVWSRHEGHGGAEFNHLYLLSPINEASSDDGDSWYTATPDPAFKQDDWLAEGDLTTPTAIARGKVLWANNALAGFANGLVGAVGSGNSSDDYPFLMLEGRIPTAIAITPNNELAFVTTWNGDTCKGELAVIALKSRDGFPYMLPNHGFFSGLKLMGYVELPVVAPTAVSATLDLSQWTWTQATDLTDSDERQLWIDREPDHQAARAGYVMVASRDEGKVVFVDITPTLKWIESMYFGEDADFEKTQNPDWPLTFKDAPEAMPAVVNTEEVSHPALVVAGYDVGDRSYLGADGLFSKHGYVATMDGKLLSFDTTGLIEGEGTGPVLFETYDLCNNPTDVAYGTGMPRRDEMLFTCRGDRKLVVMGPDGVIQRTLADDRVSDPVAGMIQETRSAKVITVADYGNNRILNYQDGPLTPWGDDVFSDQPEPGSFLYLGLLEVDGPPVAVSAAEVP